MSIVAPPMQFGFCSTNIPATGNPGTNPGTAFTPGLSNADGTAVQFLPALAHDVHLLTFEIFATSISAAAHNVLADILVDPAGGSAWSELISDILAGYQFSTPPGLRMWFPIFIRAGSSLGVRARTSHTTSTAGRLRAWAFGEPDRPSMWWCGSKVETLGANPAASKGTAITPGNSGVYSAWVDIGISTMRYGHIQFGFMPDTAALTAQGYAWEFGYDSTMLRSSPRYHSLGGTSETQSVSGYQPITCDIPAGKTLQGRSVCSGTGLAHTINCHGVA